MSNDTLAPRIDLLQEQIENLVNSGYFTEKEMDKLSFPLREELDSLKRQLTEVYVDEANLQYGLTPAQMEEGRKVFNNLWKALDWCKNPILDIQVIDAEILTPNHITA